MIQNTNNNQHQSTISVQNNTNTSSIISSTNSLSQQPNQHPYFPESTPNSIVPQTMSIYSNECTCYVPSHGQSYAVQEYRHSPMFLPNTPNISNAEVTLSEIERSDDFGWYL